MVARKQRSLLVWMFFLTCLFMLGGATQGFSKDNPQVVPSQQIQRVSLNRASVEELETVRGIGPVIAKRIVDYRAANGSFKSLEELAAVNGIGKAKFERIREQLTL